MSYEDVYYFDLTEDEHVVLFLRRHIITNVKWVLMALFLFVFPPIIIGIIPATGPLMARLAADVGWWTLLIWYLVALGFSVEQFLVWYFNVYIVTNKRIIDVDVKGFLNRTVAEAPLANVQDVTFFSKGVWATIFNFGDVHVQTAGVSPEFDFHLVGDPGHAHDIITDQLKVYQKHSHD